MIKRTLKGVAYIISGLVSAVLVLLVLGAWRLHQGPVSLDFVTHTLEEMVSSAHAPYRIDIGGTILTWAGWERAVDVRFSDVRVVDADNATVAQVPEVALGIAPKALLKGVLALSEVEIFRPRVRLVRSADGTFSVVFGEADETSGSMVGETLKMLLTRDDADHPLSYLNWVRIVDASVLVEERGLDLSWYGYVPDAQLKRRGKELDLRARLRLTNGGESADLNALGSYSAVSDRFDVDFNFASLRPSALTSVATVFAPLASIDIPLQGVLSVLGTADDGIASVEFDMRGMSGSLAISDAVATQLGDKAWAQHLQVDSLALHGVYDGERASVDVDDFSLTLAEGSVVLIPPLDHEMPVAALKARGSYVVDPARFVLRALDVDLTGPRVLASGEVHLGAEPVRFSADLELSDLRLDDLSRFWPSSLEPLTREWMVTHLSEGVLGSTTAHVDGTYGADEFDVEALTGTIAASGVTVAYFPPLPPADGVGATATFDANRFSIAVLQGAIGDIKVTDGSVIFDNLSSEDAATADIDVNVAGPLPDILTVLDHEPLGYAAAMGIDTAGTQGRVNSRLRIQFPLLEDVDLDDLAVIVAAEVTDVEVATDLFLETLRSPRLYFGLDNEGMDVNGPLVLGKLTSDITWRENFGADAPFRGRYTFTAPDLNVEDLLHLGFDRAPLVASQIDGRLATTATITEFASGERHIEAAVDSVEARVTLPFLGWTKPPGVPARMDVEARMQGDRLTDIPKFSLLGDGLSITGSAQYDAAGALQRLDVDRLIVNRTNLAGFVEADVDAGWKLAVTGNSLDLSHIWSDVDISAVNDGDEDAGCPRMAATIDVGTVWLGADQRLNAATGDFECDGKVWRTVRLTSSTQDGSPVTATVMPEADGTRSIVVQSDNAGEALRTLGIYPNMKGGTLSIDGVFHDDQDRRPLSGELKVKNYYIVNAPGLARILGAMSLAGMVGALSGDGIAFSTLQAPFLWKDDILTITDAKAAGSALGLTASGDVVAATNLVAVNGTVVPFYMVNSALGYIPLLGDVLTGGEEGGGVFAARYKIRGPLDDPDVSVNPVSALAPGFLRNLFGVFEGGAGTTQGGASERSSSAARGNLPQPPQP